MPEWRGCVQKLWVANLRLRPLVIIRLQEKSSDNESKSCLPLKSQKMLNWKTDNFKKINFTISQYQHASVGYGPSLGAGHTQFNTLCSSFITCSMSSDFMGGLEYWPESSPCPSLALLDKNKGADITAQSWSFSFALVLLGLFVAWHTLEEWCTCASTCQNTQLKTFRRYTWGLFHKADNLLTSGFSVS